ncbi:hypothetical protein J1605_007271 [Eschrichtius robustus]|uniref:Uncharacterized protein n=1 Tax=Eschrichtius robustus TaxID=9764 RepID=A0AB34H4N9_ESCRO|nr:hypothetical protein J1605_007271 [Eschrichtius robustus]
MGEAAMLQKIISKQDDLKTTVTNERECQEPTVKEPEINTTLQIHFFGKRGERKLHYKEFRRLDRPLLLPSADGWLELELGPALLRRHSRDSPALPPPPAQGSAALLCKGPGSEYGLCPGCAAQPSQRESGCEQCGRVDALACGGRVCGPVQLADVAALTSSSAGRESHLQSGIVSTAVLCPVHLLPGKNNSMRNQTLCSRASPLTRVLEQIPESSSEWWKSTDLGGRRRLLSTQCR